MKKNKRFGLISGIALLLAACTAMTPPKPNLPPRAGLVPGETITVHSNQNVYAIAHEHNVSMRDLIVLNDIQPPFVLRPGQKLVLPAPQGYQPSGSSMEPAPSGPIAPAPSPAYIGAVEQTALPPVEPPPHSPAPPPRAPETKYVNTPKPAIPSAEVLTTPSPAKPVPSTASGQVASIAPPAPQAQAEPPPEAPSISFIWPVQGPVLSAYGPKGQGLNNDGVNIGAPKGAPVVAAASGIVVYAGNEMKGYGNLVLIRHQGGWVTAYAHLDRALVTKDAVVAQGDMIGTVGKTGGAAAPQLHFETRYQGKPVDPNGVVKKD